MQRTLGSRLTIAPSPAWRSCAVALLVSLGGAARADDQPPIVLALDPCAEVDAQEVRRLVPIEMGAPVAAGEVAPRDTTRVSVGCIVGSPQLVRLEVRDAVTGKTLERVITLVGVPKADRARLVAIASVELVAASRGGGREPEAPAPAPVAAAPSPPTAVTTVVTKAPEPEAPSWQVLAVGSLRGVGGLPRLLPGAGLALRRALPRHLGFAADVTAEGSPQPTALTNVDALLVSAGLVGLVRGERGALAVEAGLGARAGWARLAGRSRGEPLGAVKGYQLAGLWGGPVAVARGALTLSGRLVLSLGGELGWATAGLVGRVEQGAGAAAPDVAVRGAWWSATVGVGYAR